MSNVQMNVHKPVGAFCAICFAPKPESSEWMTREEVAKDGINHVLSFCSMRCAGVFETSLALRDPAGPDLGKMLIGTLFTLAGVLNGEKMPTTMGSISLNEAEKMMAEVEERFWGGFMGQTTKKPLGVKGKRARRKALREKRVRK